MSSSIRAQHMGRCLASMARTGEEFEAVFEALDQFIQNTEDYIASNDEPDDKAVKHYHAAVVVLDRMLAAKIEIAEENNGVMQVKKINDRIVEVNGRHVRIDCNAVILTNEESMIFPYDELLQAECARCAKAAGLFGMVACHTYGGYMPGMVTVERSSDGTNSSSV